MHGAIEELVRFQTDRGLDKREFDGKNEAVNILEELLESFAYDIPKEDRSTLFDSLDLTLERHFLHQKKDYSFNETEVVDAYADVIVFAIGALLKLGYDPEKVLLQVSKEINSRTGRMIDGKFEKDTSAEAKANWYKADFTKCKRN